METKVLHGSSGNNSASFAFVLHLAYKHGRISIRLIPDAGYAVPSAVAPFIQCLTTSGPPPPLREYEIQEEGSLLRPKIKPD